MRSLVLRFAVAFIVTAFILSLAGCTEYERDGFSPIPHNSPASWEINPYGEIQN